MWLLHARPTSPPVDAGGASQGRRGSACYHRHCSTYDSAMRSPADIACKGEDEEPSEGSRVAKVAPQLTSPNRHSSTSSRRLCTRPLASWTAPPALRLLCVRYQTCQTAASPVLREFKAFTCSLKLLSGLDSTPSSPAFLALQTSPDMARVIAGKSELPYAGPDKQTHAPRLLRPAVVAGSFAPSPP